MNLRRVFEARRQAHLALLQALAAVALVFQRELKDAILERDAVRLCFEDWSVSVPLHVLDDVPEVLTAWWHDRQLEAAAQVAEREAAFERWRLETLRDLIERRKRELDTAQAELAACELRFGRHSDPPPSDATY